MIAKSAYLLYAPQSVGCYSHGLLISSSEYFKNKLMVHPMKNSIAFYFAVTFLTTQLIFMILLQYLYKY